MFLLGYMLENLLLYVPNTLLYYTSFRILVRMWSTDYRTRLYTNMFFIINQNINKLINVEIIMKIFRYV